MIFPETVQQTSGIAIGQANRVRRLQRATAASPRMRSLGKSVVRCVTPSHRPVWLFGFLSCLFAAVAAAATPDSPDLLESDPVSMGGPLLAYWSFDDLSDAMIRDVSGLGHSAMVGADEGQEGTVAVEVERALFGKALRLAGSHRLQVSKTLTGESLDQITLSVWTLPTDLRGYREIFRKEDGDHRILFSFQNDGNILSLGLNINGYVECDARIDPNQVLDGLWHHCAATFDGREMRVYFDGHLVQSLERVGAVATRADAPAFIGSSSGRSEFFQGRLDDLRIYRRALPGEAIGRLFTQGQAALERCRAELQRQVNSLYLRQESMASTLAACRKAVHSGSEPVPSELLVILQSRLHRDFPTTSEDFSTWIGRSLADFLSDSDPKLTSRIADRFVRLAAEYKPLTEQQWARQTAVQRQYWDQVARREREYLELTSRSDLDPFGAEWIEFITRLGSQIEWRPVVFEAVAPYMQPVTPETRDRTAAEADELLQRDWLHQANGTPTRERIASEIRWTRELAQRITADSRGRITFAESLSRLDELERSLETSLSSERIEQRRHDGEVRVPADGMVSKEPGSSIETRDVADPEMYFAVRRIKRHIMLANPVVDFDRVLLVDMPFPAGSEWPHETRHRLGYMAIPGGRLLVLEGLRPNGHLRQLAPRSPLHGSFWRPDLSFDGQKVLFCFKPHNEKSFHLYEVNIDGTEWVQLTDGPFDDLDPIYLPDEEHIVFSTTRGHTYVRCMPPTNAYVLARCDRDGTNTFLISRNNEPDYLPSVMNDGRILYTRWEYTDKPLWRAQSLWTVNPDGTQASTFWGNQSVWPDLLKDARSIPGSQRVMFTGSAHHNWFHGAVGIIDPQKGFNFPHGLTKVTADLPWPESGNGPVDPIESSAYHASGRYEAYYSPFPLGERDFLVSANRAGKFVLYLMDTEGNRELIFEGEHHVFHAQPVRARVKPPVIDDRVVWPTRESRQHPQNGVIFSSNVYEGAPAELRGRAKYLRVLNIDPKTYTYWYKRPYISTGPVVSAVQSDGVKRVLGTVPVEEDGSVNFYAPAGQALHFQLLDDQQRALQTMRSFTGVMPGEYRGCLGCHETHSTAPPATSQALAIAREPSRITPPPWGVDTVSYSRYVQPVLDQYCGECHQGTGEAKAVLDLTFRPDSSHQSEFAEPYLTLIGRPTWGQPYTQPAKPPPGWGIADTILVEAYSTVDDEAYRTPVPMTRLSYRSRLIELCCSGQHYDVRIDPVSRLRLIIWIDTMCPFRGEEEIRAESDPQFQGVDWLSLRPRIQTAPEIIRPGPVD
jgi:hypothetical protein